MSSETVNLLGAEPSLVQLVEEFDAGRAPGEFHHADHVRVAFAYVVQFPFVEAVTRFSAALKRFATTKGKPQLYHETITWAYLVLIRGRWARAGSVQTWEDFAQHNPDLLIWKGGVLAALYRQETLDSDFARHNFVLPDKTTRQDKSIVASESLTPET
jgi:hypothetical protein